MPQGTALIPAGIMHVYGYFMLQGAARSYFFRDAHEVSSWFAFEGEVVGSLSCYLGQPAREQVELLEDSLLISVHLPGLRKLSDSSLLAATLVRRILEEYTLFLEDRLSYLQFGSAKQKLEALIRQEPDVFRRVPLTHIASYLGMSRETLSRIRARL
ncbi:MAG: Crp/Fnr family transcriptional regulator [Sphingobacteriia bacterium]